MKILFALTYYRPHWTGLTQYSARLAESLTKKGHQVRVVCYRHQAELPKKEKIARVEVNRVPYWLKLSRSLLSPLFLPKILGELMKNRPEAVVIYLPFQEVLPLTLMAKALRIKVFLVHNGDLVLPKGWFNRLLEFVFYWSTNISIKLSNKIIIQTEDYAANSKLLAANPNKWSVILPLYDIPKISKKKVDEFKEKQKVNDQIIVGYSGRFVEEKGIDILLKAIALIIKKNKNIVFLLAGENKVSYENYWGKICKLYQPLKNKVKLLGLLDDKEEIYAFYRSLSLYVQPSRTDCFPSSQAEAMQCQVPSVCSDTPGARWMVKETDFGKVVKWGDAKSLAEGILSALKTDYTKNYQKVLTIFNNEKSIKRYEELFENY